MGIESALQSSSLHFQLGKLPAPLSLTFFICEMGRLTALTSGSWNQIYRTNSGKALRSLGPITRTRSLLLQLYLLL